MSSSEITFWLKKRKNYLVWLNVFSKPCHFVLILLFVGYDSWQRHGASPPDGCVRYRCSGGQPALSHAHGNKI